MRRAESDADDARHRGRRPARRQRTDVRLRRQRGQRRLLLPGGVAHVRHHDQDLDQDHNRHLHRDGTVQSKISSRSSSLSPWHPIVAWIHSPRHLEPIYFTPKDLIDTSGFLYHGCKIVQSGADSLLNGTVVDSAFGGLSTYQTCQIYQNWYDSPLVVCDAVYYDDIGCVGKNLYVVDACA